MIPAQLDGECLQPQSKTVIRACLARDSATQSTSSVILGAVIIGLLPSVRIPRRMLSAKVVNRTIGEPTRPLPWGTNPAFAIRPVKEGIYFIYTVPASGLGTFSAAENVIIPAGLTAYYCTTLKTYEDGKLGVRVFRLNGIIPANTGVLLEGSAGLSYPLTATNVEATAPAGNSLVAVVESQHIAATNGEYTNFMMKGGKFIKIQQDDESVKMPANRAYLPLLTSAISGSNAKEIMLYWDDEEATGIEIMRNVENEIMRNGKIYNLNGQKLSAPQKGINIINGRKVIVK